MYIANKDGSKGVYVNSWNSEYTRTMGQHRYQVIINEKIIVLTIVEVVNQRARDLLDSELNPFIKAINNGDNLFVFESWK